MGDIKEKDKKEEITVSVLVAVYNGEKYLEQCLSSLLAQTLQNVQIICVDDCSTDSSLEILHKYQQIDDRVEVIHLEKNQGQGHARNVALSQAKGKYICFLDSDDTLSADALQSAVAVFENHEKTDSVLFHVEQQAYLVPGAADAMAQQLAMHVGDARCILGDGLLHFLGDDLRGAATAAHLLYGPRVGEDGRHVVGTQHAVEVLRHLIVDGDGLRGEGVDEDVLDLYENVRWLVVIDLYMFYFKNRDKLSGADRNYGINEIKRVWKGIELSRLNRRYLFKFGYIPFRPFWTLFRIQEELYFALRKLIKKTV